MPKTVDHDEYRKELLQECFDLFGRMGFSNATMRLSCFRKLPAPRALPWLVSRSASGGLGLSCGLKHWLIRPHAGLTIVTHEIHLTNIH
jgi:hypothetical protein